jgi:hypothetical protein
VVNGSFELEMGKREGERLREIDVQDEFALFEWGVLWTLDGHLPME